MNKIRTMLSIVSSEAGYFFSERMLDFEKTQQKLKFLSVEPLMMEGYNVIVFLFKHSVKCLYDVIAPPPRHLPLIKESFNQFA